MKRRILFSFALASAIPVAIAATATPAQAQPAIEWYPSSGLALGTGCSSIWGDTALISFGNSVAVLFSKFGVDLPAGGPNTALADLKNCSIRIPAKLRKGFYFSELVQTVTYGVNKSANTYAKIATNSNFYGAPINFTVLEPLGVKNVPLATHTKTTPFLVLAACAGKDLNGLYLSDMAVTGNRNSKYESIILGVQGLDLRYDITIPILLCSFP